MPRSGDCGRDLLQHAPQVRVPRVPDDADLHRASRLSSCCSAVMRRAMPAGGQPEGLELLGARRLLDQPVGHAEGDDPHLGVGGLQRLGQVGAEAVHDRPLLHRDQHAVLLRQRLQHRGVQRLEEPAVHHAASMPSAASSSAACTAGCTIVPTARMATSPPRRSCSQVPYGTAGISAAGRGSAGALSRG